jgi:hypothetical protein
MARRAAGLATADDFGAQVCWRRVRATVLAGRGRVGEAQRLAAEAVALAERTDNLNDHAAALEDLAGVHDLAGHAADAHRARLAAMDLYRGKGNTVSAVRLERTVTSHATA